MQNFLRDRRSVREFRNKKASNDMLDQVAQDIENTLSEAKFKDVNIGLTLHKDGGKIFENLEDIGGYAGVMIKSPHYVSLQLNDDSECTEIYGAYYTEKLISRINDIGLEACWITLEHVEAHTRVKALGDLGKNTAYILAIGYPPRKNPFTKGTTPSERMGVDKLVFQDVVENPIDMEVLEERRLDDLFYYVRFAPSSRNSQPWRFLLKNNKIKLLMIYCQPEELALIDAGVMMYYFEQMARSIGINREWKLLDGVCEGEIGNYKYIAEYEI